MAGSRIPLIGGIVTAALLAFAVLFFVQTKDPMILAFSLISILTLWVVLLIVQVIRRGIPVRVVGDERKP